MKCQHENSSVLETRVREDGRRYRRRYCEECCGSFSTIEIDSEVFAELQSDSKRLTALRNALREAVK